MNDLQQPGGDTGQPAVVDLLHSGWYTADELAPLLKVDPSTLRRWRTAKPPQGPPFVRLAHRTVVYSIPDTQAWLESQRTVPPKPEAA
ncbi:DNA-binding protein [Kitasatospora sp. YST-16]|uniref:helix-turn-helix transcriptional regulator n=1 Tax=Kitasatospora sp. YST-16 TaxID=2998080 RepID=UPI0022849FD5|nr:DNA-binding protein [Kitasatospora sp. YST-16]WAL74509.1 DNA-binding protein [Kitasatospora sp. YST-16]WNW40571.1 DNA-binding protein [Streptomyces sp. Li-HN-5-13]